MPPGRPRDVFEARSDINGRVPTLARIYSSRPAGRLSRPLAFNNHFRPAHHSWQPRDARRRGFGPPCRKGTPAAGRSIVAPEVANDRTDLYLRGVDYHPPSRTATAAAAGLSEPGAP
ncbi:hypothetical protein A33M_0019 [Rhodovulum sp. PH10]|nr:hypothetical protein A33M_0019 [Rhodovulum sp. PH10]